VIAQPLQRLSTDTVLAGTPSRIAVRTRKIFFCFAATENPDDIPRVETSDAVKLNVLKLFNEQLGVPVKPSDIIIIIIMLH